MDYSRVVIADDVVRDAQIHQRNTRHLSLSSPFEKCQGAREVFNGLGGLSLLRIVCPQDILNPAKRLVTFQFGIDHAAASKVGGGLLPPGFARVDLAATHTRFGDVSLLSTLLSLSKGHRVHLFGPVRLAVHFEDVTDAQHHLAHLLRCQSIMTERNQLIQVILITKRYPPPLSSRRSGTLLPHHASLKCFRSPQVLHHTCDDIGRAVVLDHAEDLICDDFSLHRSQVV